MATFSRKGRWNGVRGSTDSTKNHCALDQPRFFHRDRIADGNGADGDDLGVERVGWAKRLRPPSFNERRRKRAHQSRTLAAMMGTAQVRLCPSYKSSGCSTVIASPTATVSPAITSA